MSKPLLALIYMEKAVKQYKVDVSALPESQRNLYDNSNKLSSSLIYNLALMYLRTNKSSEMITRAFELFLEVLQVNPNNPCIWLHLSQCCIQLHKKKLEASGTHGTIENLGNTRKSVLNVSNNPKVSFQSKPFSDAAFPEPTLVFGRIAAINAINCLTTINEKDEGLFILKSSL